MMAILPHLQLVPIGYLKPQAVREAIFEVVVGGGFSGELDSVNLEYGNQRGFQGIEGILEVHIFEG